jgi:hypothetical protein
MCRAKSPSAARLRGRGFYLNYVVSHVFPPENVICSILAINSSQQGDKFFHWINLFLWLEKFISLDGKNYFSGWINLFLWPDKLLYPLDKYIFTEQNIF